MSADRKGKTFETRRNRGSGGIWDRRKWRGKAHHGFNG